MQNKQFKFILYNFFNKEKKQFIAYDRTMNEAISKAYIETHRLRKISTDNWQIISAVDTDSSLF